jgi:hypothetical protein
MLETQISGTNVADSNSVGVETVDPISLMIARFATSAERGAETEQGIVGLETTAALQFLFTTLAATQIDAIHLSLSQNPTNYPGHLIAQINGRTVYIPFHLVELVPSGEALQWLVQQAEAVRVFVDSTICLSGSATFGMQFASDVDFCEYVPHTGKRIAQSFLAKAMESIPFCIEVRHGKDELEYPWNPDKVLGLCLTDRGGIGDKCTCVKRDWKFDYVGQLPDGGAISISNLCVHEDDAEALSWSFQEIPITEKAQPIRYLVAPGQLGKYVLWLRAQVGKYRDKRPDKALKRALSLAQILRLNSQSEKLLALARTPSFANYCRGMILADLEAACARVPATIQTKLGTSRPQESNESSFRFPIEDCYKVLDNTTRISDNLMARARELAGG